MYDVEIYEVFLVKLHSPVPSGCRGETMRARDRPRFGAVRAFQGAHTAPCSWANPQRHM